MRNSEHTPVARIVAYFYLNRYPPAWDARLFLVGALIKCHAPVWCLVVDSRYRSASLRPQRALLDDHVVIRRIGSYH